jgi:hypothetical protein
MGEMLWFFIGLGCGIIGTFLVGVILFLASVFTSVTED